MIKRPRADPSEWERRRAHHRAWSRQPGKGGAVSMVGEGGAGVGSPHRSRAPFSPRLASCVRLRRACCCVRRLAGSEDGMITRAPCSRPTPGRFVEYLSSAPKGVSGLRKRRGGAVEGAEVTP